MVSSHISRRWLQWSLAGLVVASLVIAVGTDTPAQTKKDPKKTETKEAKEAKVTPPPATFPKRVDAIDPAQGGVQHVTLIDEQIQAGWKNNNTYPSERCTDYEFIRRASLDIIGRIPTVQEINTYMKQPAEKRRSWLINEMLDGKDYGYGAEYAKNFADLWTVLLLTRSGSNPVAQEQMHDWLYYQLKGDEKASNPVIPDWSKIVRGLVASQGSTTKENATNFLLHNLGEELRAEQAKGKGNLDTAKNGRWDMVPATSRTTRLFLGIRTQCVQCHDHPFNAEWKQESFWGINAFFREIDTPRGRPTMMMKKKKDKNVKGTNDYDLVDNSTFNSSKLVHYERRNTVILYTDPTFLDGKKIPKGFKGTRREALADFIVKSPFMAKSFVNRTWGHFFGKSFTKDSVDDFSDGNPPSHPELLDKLAEDWAKNYGHNPKVLIRWICNSQAYGLSSKANKWNDKTDDETLFARMLLKPMTPEQMFESMMIASGDPRLKDKEKRKESKEQFLNRLTVNFGNDEGEEGSYSGTVVQALMLMNGQDINNAITDPKEGAVAAIIAKRKASFASLPYAIDDMFMQVLSRPASPKEKAAMIAVDKKNPSLFHFRKHIPGTVPTDPQFWTYYYQDIMWALLNSNEFILNH